MANTFNVSFAAHDKVNNRHLYMKADGKRFSGHQTVKICSDVKYETTVTVKPTNKELKLEKIIIGGDDITPDSSREEGNTTVYLFSWITNGFAPTPAGKRNDLRMSFHFPHAELATSFQVKFYSVEKSSNLTWGTEIHKIELEGRGIETIPTEGAAAFQHLAPTKVTFK